MEDSRTTDLAKLIAPPDNVGWKTAAPVKYLSKMEPLLTRLLQVAPKYCATRSKGSGSSSKLVQGEGCQHVIEAQRGGLL